MRLRFTIRDLLWLTLVAGLAMSWWLLWQKYTALEQSASVKQTRALQAQLSGYEVEFAVAKAAAKAAEFEITKLNKELEMSPNIRRAQQR